MRSVSLVILGLLLGLSARALAPQASPTRVARTPTPRPAPPKPSLSAEDAAGARKVLAAAVEKRQASQVKPASATAAAFRAHRCAVLHDPLIFGRERELNGPFRTTCSDWVARQTQALAVKDAAQPCVAAQYGPNLSGCTSWVDHWDAGGGKWVSVWHKTSP